jgi:ferredoxin
MRQTGSRADLILLLENLRGGKIDRRQFLRAVKVMGLSLGAAELLSACGLLPKDTTPYPDPYEPSPDDPTLVAAGIDYQKRMLTSQPPAESPPIDRSGQASLPQSSGPPKRISWLCVTCGKKLPSVEALKAHAVEMHSKRLPDIDTVETPTYRPFITGPVPRFDERNTAFSRSMWDKAYGAQIEQATEKFRARVQRYSLEEKISMMEGQALVAGAIYVDDTAGALHENYGGYMGHMDGVGGLYGWDDPINPDRMPVDDPEEMTQRIKAVAKFFGANLVGITRVDPAWLYSNYFERASGKSGAVAVDEPYAIVIAVEMGWDEINKSPGYPASAAAALGYSRMAEVAASLARYIRALGYPALPSGNDTALNIPLAIDAGLGEHGRNGLLLTPEFGPRQRLCKVFTSLPLLPDQPIDFGIVRYCETCHACASSCPVDAVPMGDRTDQPTSISNRTGIKRWMVNVTDCLLYWRQNGTDCGNCIAACPWALRSIRDWLET